jgi:hypothetical protein
MEKAKGKVRVYQAQSRLVGLHTACALVMARIAGACSPRFSYVPKRVSERVKEGQPHFKGEAARLNDCELCEFRALTTRLLAGQYNMLTHALRPIQSAEDRALTKGQIEVINYIRKERLEAAHADIAADEQRAQATLPAEFPPPRSREPKSAKDAAKEGQRLRARRDPNQNDLAIISEAILGPPPSKVGGIARREGPLTATKTTRPEGARFTFNVPGVTGEGRDAKLPNKKGRRIPKLSEPELMARRFDTRDIILGTFSEQVPERASVNWLKVERDTLRRSMVERALTSAEEAKLAQLTVALKQRGIHD